ncbi:MAG: MFS transporter [Novosphingobium sp.]|nr:MFS transporter [Novosphingobium sp.]
MRIYYGWIIVVLAGLVMMLAMGTTVGVYGLYVIPVAEEMGLSRADVNTAFAANNIGGVLLAPLIGRAADTFPVRRVMAFGALCYVVSFVGIGLSQNLWVSAALMAFALPFVIGGLSSLGAMTIVARWFEAQRARALALSMIGMSMGAVVMAPIVGWLIAQFGWRNALIGQGVVIGVLFAILILFLRERPGPDDVEPLPKGMSRDSSAGKTGSDPASHKALSTRQLLSIPTYLVLAPAMALGMGTFQAVTLSLVPMAQEAGISVGTSALLLSVIAIAGVVGKFGVAIVGDRIDKALLASICLILTAILIAMLPLPKGTAQLFALAALVGLIAGSMLPLFMAILADVVGANSFASANGMASLVIALIGAITIRLSGDLYDLTGTYHTLFLTLAAAYAASSVLMLVISRMMRANAQASPAAAIGS